MNNLLIVQELNKFAKSEYKGDAEVSVIQQIIQLGLDREELRDEIYVQIMRQVEFCLIIIPIQYKKKSKFRNTLN